jgi:D-arabinose 1-dehydrogenase-like Zn-dependent alcohol dehydrogenase
LYGSDYTNDNDITTGGLWKFDRKSFVEFTKKDGLANTSIYSLTEDKDTVYGLKDVQQAYRRLEKGNMVGKIVISI